MNCIKKYLLPVIFLTALGSSAVKQLDGELLFLNVLRGDWILSGEEFPTTEGLSQLRLGQSWNPTGAISSILTSQLFYTIHEGGIFFLTLLSICLSTVMLVIFFFRVTKNSALSMVLSAVVLLGVVSDIKDFPTALSLLIHSTVILGMFSGAKFFIALAASLTVLHSTIDGSFALPWFLFFLLSPRRSLKLLVFIPLLLSLVGLNPVVNHSVYSFIFPAITFIFFALASLKAKSSTSPVAVIVLASLTATLQSLGMRFPVFALYIPVIVGLSWNAIDGPVKNRFETALSKLELSSTGFLTSANYFAFCFLAVAFTFFELSGLSQQPVNDSYLPREALDKFVEHSPTRPPLHPIDIGGYLGLRLSAVISEKGPVNYLDNSPISLGEAPLIGKYLSLFAAENDWRGDLQKLNVTAVLCQGKNKLCKELRGDENWTLEYETPNDLRVERYLKDLPEKQRQAFSERLRATAWSLYFPSSASVSSR